MFHKKNLFGKIKEEGSIVFDHDFQFSIESLLGYNQLR